MRVRLELCVGGAGIKIISGGGVGSVLNAEEVRKVEH